MKAEGFFVLNMASDSEGRKYLTSILKVVLIVSIFIIPLMLLLRYLDDPGFTLTDLGIAALFLVFMVAYYLVRKNRFLVSALVFISASWLGMTYLAGRSAGIHDISIIGYIIIIYLATLLTGYWLAVFLTALSIVSIWIMAIAEYKGILVPYVDPPLLYARDFTVFFILVLTVIILFERSLSSSFRAIEKELEDRVSAEEKLRLNEKHLLRKSEELKEARIKAEESDRLKLAFIHNVSREINTPMNEIVGLMARLKGAGKGSEERKEALASLIKITDQLTDYIDDIIEISKVQAGSIEKAFVSFNPVRLLEDVKAYFSAIASGKGLALISAHNIPDITIISDREKLKKVMFTLIHNAIKYTMRGSVKIGGYISGGILVITFADTGTGIPAEIVPRIFDYFSDTRHSSVESPRETGYGLAVCKGYLDFLGGEIKVESEPGRGSVFTIAVPVEIPL